MAKNADISSQHLSIFYQKWTLWHTLAADQGPAATHFLQIWSRIVANAQYLLHVIYEMLQNMARSHFCHKTG